MGLAPVAQRLRTHHPGITIVHSFTSPSLARWPEPWPTDHGDYLPPGPSAGLEAAVAAVNPSLVVVARGDLWPGLTDAAARLGIPVTVAGGRLSPRSQRRGWAGRRILQSIHRQIAWLGAASPADARRWIDLGVPAGAVEVTGDPRDDHVLERWPAWSRILPLRDPGRPTFLAGSLHPEDEHIALGAFARLRDGYPASRLLVVHHEPSSEATDRVGHLSDRLNLAAQSWKPGQAPPATPVTVVEVTGLLADLYGLADGVYVGGGFGRGSHSVSEPAAWGRPTVTGPEAATNPEAVRFLDHGLPLLPYEEPARVLGEQWQQWLAHPATGDALGRRLRSALTAGAASQTTARLLGFL